MLKMDQSFIVVKDLIDTWKCWLRYLQTEQKYAFEILQAVSTGICSIGLSCWSLEAISHAEWITIANQILKLCWNKQTLFLTRKTPPEYKLKMYCIANFIFYNIDILNGGQSNCLNLLYSKSHKEHRHCFRHTTVI